MKVVITGASGYIGGALARRFVAAGCEVLGIDRIESPIPSSHRLIRASLNEPVDAEIFRFADLVIHCAHDMSPGSYRRNVDGTRKWADQARECGTRNQLFLTSVSAHRRAPSEYGKAKFELESYFLEKGEHVVRPGLVAGPGGSFAAIVGMLRNRAVVPVPGANKIRLALTDIQTLSQVILNFEKLRKGTCYNLIQPEWPGFWDFAKKVRHHFGVQGMTIPLNVQAAKLVLWVAGVLRFPLPATLNYASFCALEQSQKYGYESSYGILGLPARSVEELLEVYRGGMAER
jgi:nucleoside-diphosphate-sugar epimerase